MDRRSSIPISDSAAGLGIHRRGWFFACFYWIAQGIYGLFAATICCFAFSIVVAIISPMLAPMAVNLCAVGVVVVSILLGVLAGYRNHRWIQRREAAKRNA